MAPSTNEEWKSTIAGVAAKVNSAKITAAIPSSTLTAKSLAKTIDHTLLKLDATEEQIIDLCKEAVQYHFASVCVRVNFVAHAIAQLKGSSVKVACVIGFHEGTQSTASKVSESEEAIAAGATELDVVINRTQVQAGDYVAVWEELSAIRQVSPVQKVILKLILETSQLSREEIVAASVVAGYAGFDYIKTSTGFCGRGASEEDVQLMGRVASLVGEQLGKEKMKVKASGGVRTLGDAKTMLDAGAERIGASAGVAIVQDFLAQRGAERSDGNGY